MGLFDDILKGLPTNAVLREKMSQIEAKYAELETENAILKDDLRKAQREIQMLKEESEHAAHTSDLDEIKTAILKVLAQNNGSLYIDNIEYRLQLQRTHLEYHLHELEKQRYLDKLRPRITRPYVYRLRQKGREFVVDNKLI